MNTDKKYQTQKKGRKGEDMAVDYLLKEGFEILERNYRYRRAEIDIIAMKKDWLVFVEVKMRRGTSHGHPEEFVSENQQQLILAGADDYTTQIQWQGNIRFDIIAINSNNEIEYFEDAFY